MVTEYLTKLPNRLVKHIKDVFNPFSLLLSQTKCIVKDIFNPFSLILSQTNVLQAAVENKCHNFTLHSSKEQSENQMKILNKSIFQSMRRQSGREHYWGRLLSHTELVMTDN